MPMGNEAGGAARFCFLGVDRESLIIEPSGVRDMIGAAADRAIAPGVDHVEYERRVHGQGGMQPRGRGPSLKTNAGDKFSASPSRRERHKTAVTGDAITRVGEIIDLH